MILQIEDILGRAIETVRPEMGSALGLDQLPGDAHPVGRLADAPFQQIADAELAADLPDIDGAALVGKGGVAGDHKQRPETRQGRRDFLDDAVGEILLLRIGAEILERQHDDGRVSGTGGGSGNGRASIRHAAFALYR